MEKQKQVDRCSGYIIHPNLDDGTRRCLIASQDEHKKRGGNFSQSVVVRRAIRFYCERLLKMGDAEYWGEQTEVLRAAKGVL